ncbi:MAG: serine/threonine-protein kinase [Planctomycetota bacterium]
MATLPEQLGPVKLVRQIGLGKHCQVWEGLDTKARKQVAIKVIVPAMAKDPGQRKLLDHELKVAQSLDHPTIIEVARFAEEGGLPHLVMEYFPAENLKKQVAAGVETLVPKLQRIVTETALALDHMHSRGWVHRDVKPDNILAADDGQVKLIDLAIAAKSSGFLGKLLGGKTPAQGSPSYMSPEQIRGEALDARSDIYSFGCVIFELIAGRPPYTGADTNDLLNKHVSAVVPAVDAINKYATTGGARYLRQMLAKKPADRPGSMQEVLQQLRSIRLVERVPA